MHWWVCDSGGLCMHTCIGGTSQVSRRYLSYWSKGWKTSKYVCNTDPTWGWERVMTREVMGKVLQNKLALFPVWLCRASCFSIKSPIQHNIAKLVVYWLMEKPISFCSFSPSISSQESHLPIICQRVISSSHMSCNILDYIIQKIWKTH